MADSNAAEGWLLTAIPPDTITEWIGSNVERGRIVASVAPVKGSSPPPLARYLLENFPRDSRISSTLAGNFTSGIWTGPSGHVGSQIEQLSAWRSATSLPLPVRKSAGELAGDLERRRQLFLEQEAEEL